MITYKLAKQLKEAGFSQKGNTVIFKYPPKAGEYKSIEDTSDWACVPTLSELIEACGDKFWSLIKSRDGTGWWANPAGEPEANGNFPEEAVAKLWLKLNER